MTNRIDRFEQADLVRAGPTRRQAWRAGFPHRGERVRVDGTLAGLLEAEQPGREPAREQHRTQADLLRILLAPPDAK